MNIAVLVSGSGTNLQEIIDAIDNERLIDVNISCVIADRQCYGMERAMKHNIDVWRVKRNKNLSKEVNELCVNNDVDMIVLAGFLSILSDEFCQKWQKRIINLHPSLLPNYGGVGMYGHHVHEAVIKNKETKSGVTVHYVTAGVDEGDIISQISFDIPERADVEWLSHKISEVEKPLLIAAIDKFSKKLFEKL